MELTLETGKLHQGLTYEDYDRQPGLRASYLKALYRSPAHFKTMMAKPKEETDALRFGKLLHSALENQEKFRDLLVIEPEFVGVTKDGKPTKSKNATDVQNQRKDWYASLRPDAIVVTEEEAYNLNGILTRMMGHKLIANLIRNGVREACAWVTDPDTGLVMKARYDLIADMGYPVDFKTTTDARPGHFLNEIFSVRGSDPRFYALSGAHYAHVSRIGRFCSGESMTFIALEKTEPWGAWVYPMDRHALEVGEDRRSKLAKRYAHCLKTDTWPCYEETASPVQIPNYVQWMEDEAR